MLVAVVIGEESNLINGFYDLIITLLQLFLDEVYMLEEQLKKYRGNYSITNQTFVFQNFPLLNRSKFDGVYEPILKVIKNILLRGNTVRMSTFLKNELGDIYANPDYKNYIGLISKEVPEWRNTIKGDDVNGNYPAQVFFYDCISSDLSDYSFIQQLIIPEALIHDLVNDQDREFISQRVDFYLPQARLVIEIDGQQHKKEEQNRISDKRRDEYLLKHNIYTVRIETGDLAKRNSSYYNQIDRIKKHLDQNSSKLKIYKKKNDRLTPYEHTCLKSTAIFRFQILVLDLLLNNTISLNDKVWNLSIYQDDFEDRIFPLLALEDLFLWIDNICKLAKIPFKRPKYDIDWLESSDYKSTRKNIVIDFSLFKRWSERANKGMITVRNDYFGNKDYFEISCADPIKYKLIFDGEESDIPVLKFFLQNLFDFDNFREGQLPIIFNALQGETTIGILPTGSGKSLCYQLVAMLQPGITIVVCPIKALMHDQKENLDYKYITNTKFITGDLDTTSRERIQVNLSKGKYQIVWISPERFQSKTFREYLNAINSKYLIVNAVIDEVHCLSEWGHDFRISYLHLIKTINNYCPAATLMGLTATASPFVLDDIKIEFNTETKNIKTLKSFSRPELNFHVHKTSDMSVNKYSSLKNLLLKLTTTSDDKNTNMNDIIKPGLIFTPNVNGNVGCYNIANSLSKDLGKEIKWYSGSVPKIKTYDQGKKISDYSVMSNDDFIKYKDDVQKSFKKDKFPILVATKAFGMGIDKSNIRFTIHYGIPGSLEALYQEAGRAGRDQNPADCHIIYTPSNSNIENQKLLFDVNTSIIDIKQLVKTSTEQSDILSIFFLFQEGLDDLDVELNHMMTILKYLKNNDTEKIYLKQISMRLFTAQKAIYRLSLLGVISDWTIENWDELNGVIEVSVNDYNDKKIIRTLNSYIQKYEADFDITKNFQFATNNKKVQMVFLDKNLDIIHRAGYVLISWTNEHIVYYRRQSILNIMNLCDEYVDEESFKNKLESYFKFSDKQFLLDEIAHKPKDVENWFSVFRKELGYDNKSFIDNVNVIELDSTLARLLESYRYNAGLNWIIGLIKLIIGDFYHINGRSRLISSMTQVMQYDKREKEVVLESTLKVGANYLDSIKKDELSKILCEYFPEDIIKINTYLADNYSFQVGLEQSLGRLRKIGEKLI